MNLKELLGDEENFDPLFKLQFRNQIIFDMYTDLYDENSEE